MIYILEDPVEKGVWRDVGCEGMFLYMKMEQHKKCQIFGLAREANFNLEGGKFPIKWDSSAKQSNMGYEHHTHRLSPHIDSVVDKIERGYRMECPDGCPNKVYDVMRDCWDIDPNQRPTFKIIFKKLDEVYRSFLPVGN
ncbi:hypothetical protein OS493_039356 [Desmophyllum pertusum]|uniref:Serine-threonine/tyrosine-protein kinase catalytic domain-containing protein n=1 Tax=Desmophyllum pertusum TaxID=174260 RepID=A0A9X0D6E5_9CNID|nr:hypothetical protein OS493_039356 [Desmophyllum pertusum]